MLQVKFVKKPQKHILSFSKVLCAPSGEWLLPLHMFSLVTKKQFKFSNTTLRWNFPQTFSVLNQQPFPLFVKILCALSTDAYSMSSKPGQAVPSLPSHLRRTCGNTSRIRARRTWELYVRTQQKKPDEYVRSSRSWRPNKTKSKEISLFPPLPKPCIRTDSPEKVRHLSFVLLYFTCLPSPSLSLCFTRGHKEELNLYE